MKQLLATTLSVVVAFSGCATASHDIAATYVSPMQYQNFDCEQLASESQRVQVKVNQLAGRLDEAASNDKAITGVGVVLFWPALFALGGTKQQEAEYARLKGEHDAIQQAGIAKKCAVTPAPAQIPSQKTAGPEDQKPNIRSQNGYHTIDGGRVSA